MCDYTHKAGCLPGVAKPVQLQHQSVCELVRWCHNSAQDQLESKLLLLHVHSIESRANVGAGA